MSRCLHSVPLNVFRVVNLYLPFPLLARFCVLTLSLAGRESRALSMFESILIVNYYYKLVLIKLNRNQQIVASVIARHILVGIIIYFC